METRSGEKQRAEVREEISSEHTGYLNRVMEKNSIFLVYGLSCNAVHLQNLDTVCHC